MIDELVLERFESLYIYSRLFKIFDRIAAATVRLEIDQKDKTPSCQAKQLVHFGKNVTQLMLFFFDVFFVCFWFSFDLVFFLSMLTLQCRLHLRSSYIVK